jgi:hypothetical protein
MSSVWDGSDGTTGVVLFNISDQPQDYQFTLSDEDYPVLNSSTEIYKFMRSDGTKLFVEQVDSGSCMMSGQLQPDEVRIFVLAPVGLASTCEEKWQLGLGSAVDLNRDCQVNFKDFIEIVNEWQQCNNPVDFNCI